MLNLIRFLAMACLILVEAKSDAIESSMSRDSDFQSLPSSFRFLGITKTMATTTTVASVQTVYVHATCLVKFPNIEPCANTPPTTTLAPTTTTTTTTRAPTTTTQRTTTTKATTTTAKPWLQIIPGSSRPVLSGLVTINKVEPPTLQVNLPEFLGGGNINTGENNIGTNPSGSNSGLGLLFNKPPLNVNMGGGISASISSGGRRRRRSFLVEESAIQPSAVKTMEITTSPEISITDVFQQDVIVETSLDDDYQEYAILGLDDISERASMPFFGKRITIVKLDRVTVTQVTTVTTLYPTTSPNDRVTVGYLGCIPPDVPTNLPLCNP